VLTFHTTRTGIERAEITETRDEMQHEVRSPGPPTATSDDQEFENPGDPGSRQMAEHGIPTVVVHSSEGESWVLISGKNLVRTTHLHFEQ
jgi:hypothetical protein